MNSFKGTKFAALANHNFAELIAKLPLCRKSAICFFVTGDPCIIPFAVTSEDPGSNDMISLFTDRTVLRIRDDVAIPYYSFEDFMAWLPPIIGSRDHPHYIKRFIRMSQALMKAHEKDLALPVATG